jgi:hypothetical protein
MVNGLSGRGFIFQERERLAERVPKACRKWCFKVSAFCKSFLGKGKKTRSGDRAEMRHSSKRVNHPSAFPGVFVLEAQEKL